MSKDRRIDRHKTRTRDESAVRQRAVDESALSIDSQLIEARKRINWRRRRRAEKSLPAWVATYAVGPLIDSAPPPRGVEILREMETAVGDSRPYQILMARGHGKTSYAEACAAFSVATGRRKFVVIVSINATQAQQILHDITRVFTSEVFVQDYPDVALPIVLLDGHTRRSQRQGGHPVSYREKADEVVLPTITDDSGAHVPTSGSCIKARALSSVRGTKHGKLRPDMVILDDIQTTEEAHSAERVDKALSLIRGDVMGLCGKKKASIICTATTIARDDVTEHLKRDRSWKTTLFRAFIRWPDEWDRHEHGLWGRYIRMLDEEDAMDGNHAGSLRFYRQNRHAMDAGAEVLFPQRYNRADGHISAVQKLICAWREMGDRAFQAEMQMEPEKERVSLEISPGIILSRVRKGVRRLTVPDGFVFVSASTDINPSYALTTTITAFARDRTAFVCEHVVSPICIDQRLNDTAYARAVFEALSMHGRALSQLGLKIDAWGIDAGGRQFDAVTSFAPMAHQICGIPACAMVGRAETRFNPLVRSRVRDAVNGTVLCAEGGRKWLAWNADAYKEAAQRGWCTEVGAPGGLSMFEGAGHEDFAIQVSNEKLVAKRERPDGRYEYIWKTRDPHDYGDCMAMCYAIAANQGISGGNPGVSCVRRPVRRRVRIV